MIIQRDMAKRLKKDKGSYIQIVIGPRQCGKSTLLATLSGDRFTETTFDDLQLRTLANNDPALFLSQYPLPLLIGEAQYAPNIFPELKKIVDKIKLDSLKAKEKKTSNVIIRLTGSNQILMDKNVKESLVGRASYYYLNTLSVYEIKQVMPHIKINHILFNGGWPELYTNNDLSPTQYLNDYIRSYIEKDIVLSAGITKQNEFHTVLGMLAARSGNLLNYSSIAKNSGVKSVTVKEWTSILERTQLIYLLQPNKSNLNKRLIKAPKIYFLDTGLALRLQGWNAIEPFMKSPQAGHIFETLVLSEIIKLMNNQAKSWKISFWRTKDGEEVDFVIENGSGEIIALHARMGIHSVNPITLPNSFLKVFPNIKEIVLVSFGGEKMYLSKKCLQLPIDQLTEYLSDF